MSPQRDHEEAAAGRVLAELAGGAEDTAPGVVEDEVSEVLRRLYVEGFGLLAYDAEPVAPRPELRSRLLAGVAGDETQEVEPIVAPAAAPAPAPAPAPVPELDAPAATPPRPAPVAERMAAAKGARSAPSPVRRRRWPAALAVLFALAAAGLGFWAAYLQSELDSERARARRSASEVALAETGRRQELAAARAALAELERRFAFVTAPAVTVFALRPPALAGQPAARAALYVAADRRHWQLEARGLRPDPASQDYQIWFVVDGIPRSGGVFDAPAGRSAVLADDDLPAGTTAVWLSLERKGGTPAPTTPILLIAERGVQL